MSNRTFVMTKSALDDEKKFYERFWALHNNRDLVKLYEVMGSGVFRRSSVLEGFESFIDESNFRGKTCLEIGTFNGLTAVVLARRFERVVSVDILDTQERREVLSLLGITNVEFVVVENNNEKAALAEKMEFDAAYVDGNHERDTETDFNIVRKCGRVLFHEYWSAQPAVLRQLHSLGRFTSHGKFALWSDH